MRMRAITLWEPWASLIANGHKTFETRGHAIPQHMIGKRVAIRAAKRLAHPTHLDWYKVELGAQFHVTNFRYFDPHSIRDKLPYGHILATAILMEDLLVPEDGDYHRLGRDRRAEFGIRLTTDEKYGDFSAGRHLWRLEDVQRLDEPIPARGFQGFWEVDQALVPLLQQQGEAA